MRHLGVIAIVIAIMSCSCSSPAPQSSGSDESLIKVGVFDGHGGAQTCIWEAVEAIKIDSFRKNQIVIAYFYM